MIKTLTTRFLLAFAMITLGYAWGKQSTLRSLRVSDATLPVISQQAENQLVVYSAHLTFRCWECTEIERLTTRLLERDFAKHIERGLIDFRVIDFQRNPDFAHRYNIVSSTVLLVQTKRGEEVGHDRLDDVWTLTRDPAAFSAYVAEAINQRLGTDKVSL